MVTCTFHKFSASLSIITLVSWRRMRRASHEGLNASTARNYYPSQLREAALLVHGILKDDRKWDDELKRSACRTGSVDCIGVLIRSSQGCCLYDPWCCLRQAGTRILSRSLHRTRERFYRSHRQSCLPRSTLCRIFPMDEGQGIFIRVIVLLICAICLVLTCLDCQMETRCHRVVPA